jgi:hypothetical protein
MALLSKSLEIDEIPDVPAPTDDRPEPEGGESAG